MSQMKAQDGEGFQMEVALSRALKDGQDRDGSRRAPRPHQAENPVSRGGGQKAPARLGGQECGQGCRERAGPTGEGAQQGSSPSLTRPWPSTNWGTLEGRVGLLWAWAGHPQG